MEVFPVALNGSDVIFFFSGVNNIKIRFIFFFFQRDCVSTMSCFIIHQKKKDYV